MILVVLMSADMTMVIGVTNPSSAVVALAVHLCAFAANACVNVFFWACARSLFHWADKMMPSKDITSNASTPSLLHVCARIH